VHLIAGLGNPGRQYRGTRHNVGFMVADELARRHGLSFETAPRSGAMTTESLIARWRDVDRGAIVAKPLTFMNLSGQAVGELLRYYRIDAADLLVIVDEVHLPLGRLRARPSGSAGGHNGLKSIIAALGTEEFARLRIGVGRGDGRRDLADHVLDRFEADEQEAIDLAVQRAAEAAGVFVTDGIGKVMSTYNGPVDDRSDD
jgi:PTH1 family peptidyl-tRNA hydrolase